MEGVAGLVGLAFLICYILVVVKMFRNGSTGMGIICILGICCLPVGSLVVLIYGWVKASAWNMTGLMIAYTVLFAIAAGTSSQVDREKIMRQIPIERGP